MEENVLQVLHLHGSISREEAVEIAHTVAIELGKLHTSGKVYEHVQLRTIVKGPGEPFHLAPLEARSTLGQADYYPPERAHGQPLSPASDVYALGCVLYRLLTGHRVFEGETPPEIAIQHVQAQPLPPRQLNPHIPLKLEEILLRCLEKDPKKRYQEGAALAHALEDAN